MNIRPDAVVAFPPKLVSDRNHIDARSRPGDLIGAFRNGRWRRHPMTRPASGAARRVRSPTPRCHHGVEQLRRPNCRVGVIADRLAGRSPCAADEQPAVLEMPGRAPPLPAVLDAHVAECVVRGARLWRCKPFRHGRVMLGTRIGFAPGRPFLAATICSLRAIPGLRKLSARRVCRCLVVQCKGMARSVELLGRFQRWELT